MKRIEDDWPVREVHSRLQLITPITLPVVDAQEFLERHERGKARRKWLWRALAAVSVGFLIATALGCAHRPTLRDHVEVVALGEPVGGAVSEVFARATGFKVKAVTIPTLPTIIFTGADNCVTQDHEGAHRAQQRRDGDAEFMRRYLTEWFTCMLDKDSWGAFAWCSHYGVSYEVEAYKVESACRAKAVMHAWDEAKGGERR
jgi:hypothetical protein